MDDFAAPMQRLSVLVVHNRYQQSGGEDAVVRAEVELLRRNGHRVVQYVRDNRQIATPGTLKKAALALNAFWSFETYREIATIIDQLQPDVAHFHNFVPLISPSAYYVCQRAGVPVVQTLHNYRLFCPAGTCFREGGVCTECGNTLFPALRKGCYRNSHAATASMAGMLQLHRSLGTWSRMVDAYVAPSRFCREFALDRGLLGSRVHVKPHFLAPDPGLRNGDGEYAIYVGRLSAEKGVLPLVNTWRKLPQIPLLVVGDGPLLAELNSAATGADHIRIIGACSREETIERLRLARFLLFPSECHETFGMALLEAAALGVPAIASRVGAVPEIVRHGETGLLFEPGVADELALRAQWAWSHPAEMRSMGKQARQQYLLRFSAESNLSRLLEIYRFAIEQHSQLQLPQTLAAAPITGLKESS